MKVLITTVVDKEYMAYAPLFVYFCRKEYPEYDVKLFLRDKSKYSIDCETVALFEDLPRYKYNTIAFRFVVPPCHYKGYDYVYITDVDIMIMRESLPIANFHENQMVETGMCYSNSIRNQYHYMGIDSLSGLHFAKQEWFEKVESQRLFYYNLLSKGLVGLYREYDGLMLYRMCQNSVLKIPGKYKLIKRHHGIHLGNFRLFKGNKEKIMARIPVEFRVKWSNHSGKREFKNILEQSRADNQMLDSQIIDLDNLVRG